MVSRSPSKAALVASLIYLRWLRPSFRLVPLLLDQKIKAGPTTTKTGPATVTNYTYTIAADADRVPRPA